VAVNVCFVGARRLGLDCLAWLQDRADVIAADVPESGWWTDCDDRSELAALGIPLAAAADFRSLKPTLVVSVLAGYIFRAEDLAAYPAVNLHPAPLPHYRGCNSYAHAIMNGDREYGVSLHYIDTGIDTGPVIASGSLPIHDDDTGRSLYDRAQDVAYDTFTEAMPRVLEGHAQGRRTRSTPQAEEARYYPRTSLQDKRTNSADERRIRALTFPPHPAPDLTDDVPVGFGRDILVCR
jgi:methionyl-tRNA formyltransferase